MDVALIGLPTVIALDEAAIHRTKLTAGRSKELGNIPNLLHPYSPGLQSIEFGWKVHERAGWKPKFDAMIDASGLSAKTLRRGRTNT